jgi:hypothetical protein
VRSGLLAATAVLTSWSLRTLQEQMIIASALNGFGRGGGGATIARISVRSASSLAPHRPAGGGATRTFNRN